MSEGRRAQLTKTMSGMRPESKWFVSIDIIGVMPEPAEMNRYFSAGWNAVENSPAGPLARTRMPGRRLSNIHCVPIDFSCALTVTVSEVGREGDEEIV